MPYEYVIVLNDVVTAAKVHSKTSRRTEVAFLFVAILGAIFAYYTNSPVMRYAAIGASVGILVFGLLVSAVVIPSLAKRQYKGNKAIQQKVQVDLKEEGIWLKNDDWEGTLRWNMIYRWREGKDIVLIYPAPDIYYAIPKRLQLDGFEISSLLDQLSSNVGKAT